MADGVTKQLVGGKAQVGPTLGALAKLKARDPDKILRHALEIAREQLGMDVAYISRFTEADQIYEFLEGDTESFGLSEGNALPLEETYCKPMVDGSIPNIIPDTKSESGVKDLAVTHAAGIGSYIGIPLTMSDGQVYGSLCCISHQADSALGARDLDVMRIIAHLVADSIEREQLLENNWRLQLESASVNALMAAIAARDGYTASHSDSVVALAVEVAELLDVDKSEFAAITQVALLHDIGKVGIPDSLLRKSGPLNDEEWAIMKTHPAIGEEIVRSIEGLSHLAPMIRAEHERWDGTGYPDGLKGSEIPLASCIVLVCDAYHAMVSDRPYRKAMSIQAAVSELVANSGTQFCPAVVDAFLERPTLTAIMRFSAQASPEAPDERLTAR